MPTVPGAVRLRLMEGFEFTHDNEPLALPLGAQRVIAFVALQERPVARLAVAGNLWLDKPEKVASASLRSALWQLRRSGLDVIETTAGHLRLAPSLHVDVHEALRHARRLVADDDEPITPPHWLLTGELLPGWYDDWVILERERIRQVRLHALEALGYRLIEQARTMHAIEAALAAVAVDPLRESAYRLLISAHLAEGNRSEALRHYDAYVKLLDENLGIEPSKQMAALIAAICPRTRARLAG